MVASPTDPHVGLVVEGRGDLMALPIMLRAHLGAAGDFRNVLGKPIPLHGRTKAFVPGGIEGYVNVAASRPGCVGVLVVFDGDKDCIAEAGPPLRERSEEVSRVPVRIVLAERNFEDWLYASAETLDLKLDGYDPDQSGLHALKVALRPASYTKPVWQPRLVSRMDLAIARSRSVSLDRCLERFDELHSYLPPAP